MWIEDLTKALWVLNGDKVKWMCCVWKIENDIIYMTNSATFYIPDLVAKYDKEHGVSAG